MNKADRIWTLLNESGFISDVRINGKSHLEFLPDERWPKALPIIEAELYPWIPVSQKPKYEGTYTVGNSKTKQVSTSYWNYKEWRFGKWTHWKDWLKDPEPPKE